MKRTDPIPDVTSDLLARAHDHMVMAMSLMRGSDLFFSNTEIWQRVSWRRQKAYNIMTHLVKVEIYPTKLLQHGRFTREQVRMIEDTARMTLSTYDTHGGHYDFWADLFMAARNEKRARKW